MVKTLCFHCRGHGFDPCSENWDPASRMPRGAVTKKKKKKTAVHQLSDDISSSLFGGFVRSSFIEYIYIIAPLAWVLQAPRHRTRCMAHVASFNPLWGTVPQGLRLQHGGSEKSSLLPRVTWLVEPGFELRSFTLPFLVHTPAEIHCSCQNMSEVGVKIGRASCRERV